MGRRLGFIPNFILARVLLFFCWSVHKTTNHISRDPKAVPASPEMLADIKLLVGQMSDLVDGHLKVPEKLVVRVLRDSNPSPYFTLFDGPGFLPETGVVRIPYRYFYGTSVRQGEQWTGKTKNPVHTRPIQIHEVAHAIFDANAEGSLALRLEMSLMNERSALRDQRQVREVWDLVQAQLNDEQKARLNELFQKRPVSEWLRVRAKLMKGRLEGTLTPEMEQRLQAEDERLQVEYRKCDDLYDEYIKQNVPPEVFARWVEVNTRDGQIDQRKEAVGKQLKTIRSITLPYNELFADAFAVVMTEDPRAMSRAIDYSVERKRTQSRDFSHRVRLSELPRESDATFELEAKIFDKYGRMYGSQGITTRWERDPRFEAHGLLDAARSHFWRRYASRPPFNGQPGLTLQTLFKALASEMDARVSDPNLVAMSPFEANRRLIDAIDREFERALEDRSR